VQATISMVALAVVLIACLKSGTLAFAILSHKRTVYIGLISYSLYLWHWGVLSISRWTIGIHWWSVPLQAALIYMLGAGSHRFVESPFRDGQWIVGRFANYVAGVVLVLASLVSILAVEAFYIWGSLAQSLRAKNGFLVWSDVRK
jgi:peptidoglycan/LPS O-acetylase OafA/YrhL